MGEMGEREMGEGVSDYFGVVMIGFVRVV